MSLGPPPYRVHLTYREAPLPDGIRANVDAPIDQIVEHGLVTEVTGWIAHYDEAAADPPERVVITVGRYGWLEAPIVLSRPDVVRGQIDEAGRAPVTERCGFTMLLPAQLVQAGGPYVLAVRRAHDPVLHEFAEIVFESLAPSAWHMPTTVRPLIVNSIGRTGSSLLCRMLSEHLAMHVPRHLNQFGEVAICGYVSRMMSVLSSTGLHSLLNTVGGLPDFHSLDPPHFSSRLLRTPGLDEYQHGQMVRTLTDGSRHLGARVLVDYISFARSLRPTLRYLVEKSWNSYNINALGLLFADVKEVFVVREPAAFMESQRAFLLKEGRSQENIDAQHAAAPNRLGNLARSYSDRRDKAHLIRYEELVSEPERVLKELFAYLDLYAAPEFIALASSMVGDDSAHTRMLRTSSGTAGETSFRSYMESLPEEERANAEAYLREFGY
jgi:hypothetical protein